MAQRLIDEIKRLIDDTLSGVHTAMPGVITSADGMTASVKPSVTYRTADGKSMNYPALSGCPIVLPMSADGKIGVAFPVTAGDACLIVCCESTLSQWQSGNYQSSLRFGLSNAICVPCLLNSAPSAVSKAKAKDAAILFSEEGEVLVGKDEIHAEFKDDYKVKISEDGIEASVKTDTKVSIKEKEIAAEAGDSDHQITLSDAVAMMKINDARVILSENLVSTQLSTDNMVNITEDSIKAQLGSDKRIEIGQSSAGIYFDSGHYIEVKSDKTHVEGDLDVSGTVTQGG